ncbi:MAG: CAP domain-containing protein [Bacillus sp. (in: Bacteria)]|nr:CAP domain-containing protein [Bacillus sp. (in: firmicutes)]
MRQFILLVMILFLGFVLKPVWEEPVQQLVPDLVWDSLHSTVEFVKENEELRLALENLQARLNERLIPEEPSQVAPNEKKMEESPLLLTAPKGQEFAIHNIKLGNFRSDVENETSTSPKRSSLNEYGLNWNTYHENYGNFFMVAYDENDVVRALYTNQGLITSTTDITIGTTKEFVQAQLGTPESYIRKGNVRYQINSNGEYDLFKLDSSYVTVFYDKHQNNTVTAIKVVDKNLEEKRPSYYSEPSEKLQEGFEYQLFDLTNASRVNHQLPILTWDEHVRQTARKHSLDMAENHFFSHTNFTWKITIERMEADNIDFTTAGENLAFGQINSIFAHEGLMNSLGHRENILREDYRYLGVGVAFNQESQPYFTKKFYDNAWATIDFQHIFAWK